MAKGMKIAKGNSIQVDSAINPQTVTIHSATGTNTTTYLGGVGGEPTAVTAVLTIKCSYKTSAGVSKTDGFIVHQRGRKQFDVQSDADGANPLVSTTRTSATLKPVAAGSLSASEMSIKCLTPAGVTFYASRISNRFVWNGDTRYRYTVKNATEVTFIDTYNEGTTTNDGGTGLAIVEGQ
jgi:hypothetical protein